MRRKDYEMHINQMQRYIELLATCEEYDSKSNVRMLEILSAVSSELAEFIKLTKSAK